MTSHRTTSRGRRGLSALLLLPLLLVLAGCFRLDMGLTINENDTLDVSMEVGDLTGMATRADMDCSELESELGDAPEDAEFAVEDIEDEDGNIGCRISATGAPIDSMTGEGMNIERVDDTYVFSFDGDETGMGDTSSLEDMPAGMEPQVAISVTFPGEVIEADGEIDGNTVTWSGIEAFAAGGSATGEATGNGSGAGGVSTAVWIVLAVVALLAIAALIFLISRKKGGRPGSADAPYGSPVAPSGQPGQVPNEPGPGFPAQPGAGQPVGGFGPSDQVPADPGPGYRGQQPPAAPAPFTTAAADTPVDRPEGSPFAPSPEPPSQSDEGQQR
ncbi:hypothetical protein M3148_04975 [Georgenia satyanarayanai]|uniref:LppM family (lipo)protein n=1 Tax=Georgenia satyanarayanai TaxID=860221 RepID=UPI00203B67CC|nr:hypothetical protein [Georgenia satyanarayanai]MCM3660348.1 hypothetical protein [Georgenia satyanarayanai]